MKKKMIFILMALGLPALLLTTGPAMAKSAKIQLGVEMCRVLPPQVCGDVICPGGTVVSAMPCDTCSDDGRWHLRDQQNLWMISDDDELSEGDDFVVGEMSILMNANCDGPPPLAENNCTFWGTFELSPYAYPNGSWVGTFTNQLHEGEWKVRFEGHGVGDLEGLKIRTSDQGFVGKPQICIPAGEPRPFTGYILDPHGDIVE